MEELERQDSVEEEIPAISILLDEMLEEIFTHLPGREQLNCRLVCHLWDDLLCKCPRLLQESVQLTIDINSSDVNLEELEVIPIIKANKALKVKRLYVDCDVFIGESALKPETVINFLREHEIHDMVEVFNFSASEECNSADILYEFLSVLTKPDTLRLTVSHLDDKADQVIVFDERWNDVTFPSINHTKLEVWGIDDNQVWSTSMSTFFTKIFNTMPNIKSITGIQGYNEEFYEKYASVIKIDRLNIHDTGSKIVHIKNLKLNDLRLCGDSDYAASEFWRRLNRFHPEIKTLHLSYSTKGAPVPIHDYTKVTYLDLSHSYGDASEQDLGGILTAFPSINSLYFSGSVVKVCFFGHQSVELPNLTEAKVFFEEDCKLTCDDCIEAYTNCLRNAEQFNTDAVSTSLLKSISKNMTKLKTLSFSTTPDPKIFAEWPEMSSLEHLIFRYGIEAITIKDIQNIYKMCPKIEAIQFEDSVSIKN